jgi:hypothetical protein
MWPLYWTAQGTMFWALFVLGHDCGHGSFSNNSNLNSVVGHILHSSILVPYHGWCVFCCTELVVIQFNSDAASHLDGVWFEELKFNKHCSTLVLLPLSLNVCL